MREIEEDTCHFAFVQTANFLCNAAQSFGKKWETVLRLRVHLERRPPNPKQERKSNYEQPKHSVQSNSATLQERGISPRVPCGSVYLGAQSHVSSRPGAVQWRRRGVQ